MFYLSGLFWLNIILLIIRINLILEMATQTNKPKYSIILPVLNEEENLPIITYMIFEMAKKQ